MAYRRISQADKDDFAGFCRQATNMQAAEIYKKEKKANRRTYASIAKAEADKRGICVD